MPENKKVQRTIITILMVAVFLMMLMLISKEILDVQNAKEEIKNEEITLEQLKSQYSYLLDLKEKAPEYEELLKVYQQKIPDTFSQSDVINYLQQIASQSNVQLVMVNYDERIPSGQYIEIPITITLNGTYNNVLGFMNNSRNGKHLLKLEDLIITTSQVDSGNISVIITAKAFAKN